jgi:segregation and condensation protein B
LATTKHFLDDLGLASLDQLPELDQDGVANAMADSLAQELDLHPSDEADAPQEADVVGDDQAQADEQEQGDLSALDQDNQTKGDHEHH